MYFFHHCLTEEFRQQAKSENDVVNTTASFPSSSYYNNFKKVNLKNLRGEHHNINHLKIINEIMIAVTLATTQHR